MAVTIGLVANIFNEANALPGWLETHLPYFDWIGVMHAGPGGTYSDDGTLEILKKWNVPLQFCAIDEGFGAVRTKTLQMCPSSINYIMLLDADERFFPIHRYLTCSGESTPYSEVDAILQTYDFRGEAMPCNWENIARLGANLRVHITAAYDQGLRLREILSTGEWDAVAAIRRHWHDFSMRRPTQNWHTDPDWQMRIVRNTDRIYFDAGTRMHEHLVGVEKTFHAEMARGPFFEHQHFTFKRMEIEQRAHDVAIYDAIHEGRRPPTAKEFRK